MQRKQIATILNEISAEVLGSDVIFAEDLSDIVDQGTTFLNVVKDNKAFDSVIGAIINKVGKTIIVNRDYTQTTPNLLRDAWEYGSILEKIRIDIPEAAENDSWALEAGRKYDDILVYDPPEVSASYWNKRITFSLAMSYPTEYQMAESFKSAGAINRFFSGIDNRIRTGMRFYTANMAQRCLNNLVILASPRRINLLQEYNIEFAKSLSVSEALHSAEFFRFAALKISLYSDYLTRLSTRFNNGLYKAHTPKADQHFCVLSQFAKAVDTYSLSDTYHNEFVKLINYETIPYWQGVGTTADGAGDLADAYSFGAVSTISATPSDGTEPVTLSGVVGILFDRDAAAIANENERVTSFYNADNETTKFYYKWDCAYQNDPAENAIVFTMEDVSQTIASTTVTPAPGTDVLFDTLVSTMQTDVEIVGNKITGTLNFIEGGIAQSGPLAGDGHFMALDFVDNAGADEIRVGLVPSAGTGLVALDADMDAVFKVTGVLNGIQQVLEVCTEKDGQTLTQIFDISGLTLAEPTT